MGLQVLSSVVNRIAQMMSSAPEMSTQSREMQLKARSGMKIQGLRDRGLKRRR